MSDYVELYKIRKDHELALQKINQAKKSKLSPRLQIAATIASGLCANPAEDVIALTIARKIEFALVFADQLIDMNES